jgi:hypothetical protein
MRGGEKNIMTYKNRIITAIATGAVLVNALAPMAFASTITVSGNGEDSSSNVNLTSNTTTQVVQTNDANISNKVDSSSSTGDNSSNGNTGGSTSITTGNATSNTTVTNAANLNQADLSNCASCNSSSTDVNISGNGEDSHNDANVGNNSGVFVSQTNTADIKNDVNADAKTGGNVATSNTGGDTTIHTGDAKTNVSVGNAANANVAQVGDGSDGSNGGSSVTISGNGEHSGNVVNLDQDSAVVLTQANEANFDNHVSAEAKSGYNSANGNTNGDVSITTGNATTNETVDNAANFNSASLDCGCATDGVGVDIDTNGEHSWNSVSADLENAVAPSQVNDQGFWNGVYGNSATGSNTSISNTGGNMWDPSVTTGNGTSNNTVNNAGNVNTLGNVDLGDYTIGTTFDFSGLWGFLNGFMI